MATFKDSKGRDWTLAINVGLVTRLRTEAGFELGKATAAADRFADVLYGEPETIARVLWVLSDAQAAAAGVSPEDFAAGLDGDALDRAAVAFMEAVLDFFHRGRSAPMKARLPLLMTKMNREIEAAAARAADSILNGSAGGTPGSAG